MSATAEGIAPATVNAAPAPAPARKRAPSAATKRANAAKSPATKPTAAKSPATKPTAAKVTKIKAAPKPKLPSHAAANRALGTAVIKAMATVAASYKMPKDCALTREEIVAQIGKWASYIPGDMDPRLTAITAGGRRKSA